nr:AlNc14C4G657 [Albugo laibachii Nc14]|eukprot:CCA14589.1 AlNc14C4G657 [Albugo laibachii Nc14]
MSARFVNYDFYSAGSRQQDFSLLHTSHKQKPIIIGQKKDETKYAEKGGITARPTSNSISQIYKHTVHGNNGHTTSIECIFFHLQSFQIFQRQAMASEKVTNLIAEMFKIDNIADILPPVHGRSHLDNYRNRNFGGFGGKLPGNRKHLSRHFERKTTRSNVQPDKTT